MISLMHPRSYSRQALLFGALALGCTTKPTGLLVVMQAQDRVETAASHVLLEVRRGGVLSLQTDLETKTLPSTLMLTPREGVDAQQPIEIVFKGLDLKGNMLIQRRAIVGFVEEKSRVLRLPLDDDCLGKLDCDEQSTCDHGTCVSAAVDANTLPDFVDNDSAIQGGQAGASGSAGQGGGAGIGGAGGTGGVAGQGGSAGSVSSPPSCVGLDANCGVSSADDCCSTATTLPGGANDVFDRGCDASLTDPNQNLAPCTLPSYPATVSSFRLDKYEVTVGRFRKFIESYDTWRAAGHPTDGEGANPNVAGTGWSTTWGDVLPADAATFQGATALACGTSGSTWTTSVSTHENQPINCVNWFQAVAFCAWDSGWLPTEAEWMYAAAGGSEDRVYPWSTPASDLTPPSDAQANYSGNTTSTGPSDVGTHPAGAGKWGHEDLAGNVWEWVFDNYVAPYSGDPSAVCNDCVETGAADTSTHVFRGGTWFYPDADYLRASNRTTNGPKFSNDKVGFRCARK